MNLRLAILAFALLLPSLARAQSNEALYDRGADLREQGDDAAALAVFTQAYELDHTARARVQMGLAEQALGHWALAHAYVSEGLAAHEPWIERNRAALEGALATILEHVGRLDLRCEVSGARILVDGRQVALTPLAAPLTLAIGTHVVAVQSGDHEPFRVTVDIRAGVLSREVVNLVPLPEPVATPTPTPVPSAEPEAAPTPVRTTEGGDVTLAIVGVASLGTGASALIAGGITWILRTDNLGSFNRMGCVAMPTTACDSIYAGKDTLDIVSALLVGGGAALAVTGLALILAAPSGAPARETVACAPVTGGMLGVACAGSF